MPKSFSNAPIAYATPLRFLQRKHRRANTMPSARPGTAMPPAALFKSKDVREAIAEFEKLSAAAREQAKQAKLATADAGIAKREFKQAVKDAALAGKDPSAIENREPALTAKAASHDQAHKTLNGQATRAGATVAGLIEQRAPEAFPKLEADARAAAERIGALLDSLPEAWAGWSTAVGWRSRLGSYGLYGGMWGNWSVPELPDDVTAALATLRDKLGDLDQFVAEEANVNEWRGKQG